MERIKKLPCFSAFNCSIEVIDSGISHHCFKVTLAESQQRFFVKSFQGHSSTVQNEVNTNQLASECHLSSPIVYSSKQWLVTEFIVGQLLSATTLSINEKIHYSMELMAKLHQQEQIESISIFQLSDIFESLISSSSLNSQQQTALMALLKDIANVPHNRKHVLCHGDMNFSNILLDEINEPAPKAWLIDFECSCLAELEFDIAMFIAINNIENSKHQYVINSYQKFSGTEVNKNKLSYYLACSYLINGLWYLSKENKNQKVMTEQAKLQFAQFDQLRVVTERISQLIT